MAPIRSTRRHHEISSTPVQNDDATTITYGTRSKRKATDMSSNNSSPSGKPTSTNSSQSAGTAEELDIAAPPTKKVRSSSPTNSPARTIEEEALDEEIIDVPEVKVDGPSDSSEHEVYDQIVSAPVGRGGIGRGRGRGRGGRGRGRGGRGNSGLTRGTPASDALPSALPKPARGRGGRGGHRVKKSSNARIQALYHRRAALKHHYKQVASLQKTALLILTEKSLDLMTADPEYHIKLPEYLETTQALNDVYQKRVDKLNSEFEVNKAFLLRQCEHNCTYTQQQHEDKVKEIREIVEIKVKQHVLHAYHQYANNSTLEKTPLFKDPDNKIVKRIDPPTTIVHSIGTPYEHILADLNNPDMPEQHPADFWLSMTADQKYAHESTMKKAGGDKGKRVKNPKASALYQPQAILDTPDILGTIQELLSAVGTPLEVSAEDTETDATESPGEEQPTDQYGVKVPKKPTPRNGEAPQNRIVADLPVTFEQHEIGIRKHHSRKNNRNEQQYLGVDPEPNPRKIYYDQIARNHNTARNKKEDLDQELVGVFKVHPTYGLPLAASENPTYDECKNAPFQPPTYWAKPLDPTNPVIFIEESDRTRKLLDEDKKVFFTSRSEWIIRTPAEFEEIPSKFKMTSALEQMDALARPSREATAEEIPVQEEVVTPVIAPGLISAVNEAVSTRVSEGAKAPSLAPVVTASARYDPIRDVTYPQPQAPADVQTYHTPYPVASPRQQPPVSNINRQPGGLGALAEAAEHRNSMPPPPAPRGYQLPQNPWVQQAPVQPAPPPHRGQQVQQGGYNGIIYTNQQNVPPPYTSPRSAPHQGHGHGHHMHAHPHPHPHPLPVPGHSMQLGPSMPNAAGSARAYKNLAPAPPQNRTNLPPPPNQQQQQQPPPQGWYRQPPYGP